MRWSVRVLLTAATPVAMIGVGAGVGAALSRLGSNDASGWGDLIGMVVGMVLGTGTGAGAMMFITGTMRESAMVRRVLWMFACVPSAIPFIATAAVLRAGFWWAMGAHLIAGAALVWWYSGRTTNRGR